MTVISLSLFISSVTVIAVMMYQNLNSFGNVNERTFNNITDCTYFWNGSLYNFTQLAEIDVIHAVDNAYPNNLYDIKICDYLPFNCSSYRGSVFLWTKSTNSCIYELSYWSDSPIVTGYSDPETGDKGISLLFTNGEPCHRSRYSVRLNFICSPEKIGQAVGAVTSGNSCEYHIDIPTMYGCKHAVTTTTTTTTSAPIFDCVWKSSDKTHTLNLTAFKGQALSLIDSSDPTLVYALSPCDNLLSCDHIDVMSYLWNVTAIKCLNYFALWENGIVRPNYNSKTKSWQFIYANGESCNGEENVFEVIWNCDHSKKNTAEIISVQTFGECIYAMEVNSSYACD